MRVTDQVTNQVAADTKIAVNANSLANSSTGPTGNALLDELNKSNANKASAVTKNKYEEIKKSADTLLESAEIFLEEGNGSLLSALDTEEGRTKLKEQITRLVNGYNNAGDKLKTSSNSLDAYYLQMLRLQATMPQSLQSLELRYQPRESYSMTAVKQRLMLIR